MVGPRLFRSGSARHLCHSLFKKPQLSNRRSFLCQDKEKSYLNSHQHNTDTGNTCLSNKMPFLPVCRGCSELYRMPVSEYKGSSSDSGSFEYKFPFRSNNNKWQRTSSSPQQSLTASPQPHTPNRAISLGSSVGKTLSAERLERGAVIPRSVSSDGRPLDTKRLESLSCLLKSE